MFSPQPWINLVLKKGLGVGHFIGQNTLCLTQNEVEMHTALQFGHHSKNQLFSKLTLCPLREILLWPLLVWWIMSWRGYKPRADNSLTDRVMVYSHIFIQHQHTRGISTLTLSFPISVHPALFQDECPEYPQPIFIALHACILQTAHFIMRMVLIARSASIYSGNFQIFFAAGPNLQPKSFWANPDESSPV